MIKYMGLKDFGIWCKKGKIGYINNSIGKRAEKKGIIKVLEYVSLGDKRTKIPNYLLKLSDEQIRKEMILNFINQK